MLSMKACICQNKTMRSNFSWKFVFVFSNKLFSWFYDYANFEKNFRPEKNHEIVCFKNSIWKSVGAI